MPDDLSDWDRLDLESDEVLTQILDRGEIDAWRELFAVAKVDPNLRRHIVRLIRRVSLPFPRFWLTALATLNEPVDLGEALPRDPDL